MECLSLVWVMVKQLYLVAAQLGVLNLTSVVLLAAAGSIVVPGKSSQGHSAEVAEKLAR